MPLAPPLLPSQVVISPAPIPLRTINVSTEAQLQAAFATAQRGDQIVVALGTYVGGIRLKQPTGTLAGVGGDNYVTVISAAASLLPPDDQRISSADLANMPTIMADPAAGGGTNYTMNPIDNGVGYYRFIGIQFRSGEYFPVGAICNIAVPPGGDSTVPANFPHHISFEHCYFAPHHDFGANKTIALQGSHLRVMDSMIEDAYIPGNGDANGIWVDGSVGPYLVRNTSIAGMGENIFCGAASNSFQNLIPRVKWQVPTDITVQRSYLYRKPSYRSTDPTYDPPCFNPGLGTVTTSGLTATFSQTPPADLTGRYIRATTGGASRKLVAGSGLTWTLAAPFPTELTAVAYRYHTVDLSAKNLFEMKGAERVLLEDTKMENCWFSGQEYALVYTPREYGYVTDFTMRYTYWKDCTGWAFSPGDPEASLGPSPLSSARVAIEHNLQENINGSNSAWFVPVATMDYGVLPGNGATVAAGATTGLGVTFTATVFAPFGPEMVGMEIRRRDGGRATIRTTSTDRFSATADITVPFLDTLPKDNVQNWMIGDASMLGFRFQPDSWRLEHNTVTGPNCTHTFAISLYSNIVYEGIPPGVQGPQATNMIIRNNILQAGVNPGNGNGLLGDGLGLGTAPVNFFFDAATRDMHKNVLYGPGLLNGPGQTQLYNFSQFYTGDLAAGPGAQAPSWGMNDPDHTGSIAGGPVGFVDFAGGNYALASTSQYATWATDGTAVGADIPTLMFRTRGCVSGVWSTVSPPVDTCSATFNDQTVVTLSATTTPGNVFAGWSGAVNSTANPVQVLMNANKAVTATFNAVTGPVTLTIVRSGSGTGVVTSNPAGISCGGTCTLSVPVGTQLSLSANADPNSSFAGWSGGLTSTANPLILTMGQDTTLNAAFTAVIAPPPTTLATLAIYERAGVTRSQDPVVAIVPLAEADAVVDVTTLDVRASGAAIPSQFRVLSRYGDVGDSTAAIRIAQATFAPSLLANAIDPTTYTVTNGNAHPTVGGLVYTQSALAHHITTGFGDGAIDCSILKIGGHNVFDQLSVRQAGVFVPVLLSGNLSTYYLHGIAAQNQDADYRSRDYTGTAYTTSVEWQGTERLVLLVTTHLGLAGAEFSGSGAEARLAGFQPSTVPGPVTIEARYTFTKDSGVIELDVLWKGNNGDWLHPQDAYISRGGLRLVPGFTGKFLTVFDESNSTTKAASLIHQPGNTNVVYYDYAPSGTAYNFSRPSTNWQFAGATTDTVDGTEGWYALGDANGTVWLALMQKEWKAHVPHGFRFDGTTLEATLWPSERGHVPSGPAYHILGGTHYYRWQGAIAVGTGQLAAPTIRALYQRRLLFPLVAHAQTKWSSSNALPAVADPVGFVMGTDGHPYSTAVPHTATAATQPITGAQYATVWSIDDTLVNPQAALPWVLGRRYGALEYGLPDQNEALSRRARWSLMYTDATAATDGRTIPTTYASRNKGVYTYYGWNRYGCWLGAGLSSAGCGCNREETVEALFAAWLAYGDPVLLEWAERLATHMAGFASWKGANGVTGTLQFGSLAPGLQGDTTLHLPEPDMNDGAEHNGMAYRPLAYLLTGYLPFKVLTNLALISQYGQTLDRESEPSLPHRAPAISPNQFSLGGVPGGNQAVGGTRLIAGAIKFFTYTFLMQGDLTSLTYVRNLMLQAFVFTHRTLVGLEGPPTNTSGALTTEGGLGTIPSGVLDNTGSQRPSYAALPAPAIRLATELSGWAVLHAAYTGIVSAADLTAMQLLVTQYVKYHLTGAGGQARNLGDTTLARPLVRGGLKSGDVVTLIGSTANWSINVPAADGALLRADANGVTSLGAPALSHHIWANLIDLVAYAATLYTAQGQTALASYAQQAARDLFLNCYLYAVYPTSRTWSTPVQLTDRGNIVTGAETL